MYIIFNYLGNKVTGITGFEQFLSSCFHYFAENAGYRVLICIMGRVLEHGWETGTSCKSVGNKK